MEVCAVSVGEEEARGDGGWRERGGAFDDVSVGLIGVGFR